MGELRTGGWLEDEQGAADSEVTATRAAEAGKQHILYNVYASYDTNNTTGTMSIKDGDTVIFNHVVNDELELHFEAGLAITPGNSVTVTVSAGSGGVVSEAGLHGITR